MSRAHVFLTLGVGLIALGVGVMTGCGGGCAPIHLRFGNGAWSKDGVDLPHEATLTLSSPEKLAKLGLSLEAASIAVEASPSVTGVEAEFVVHEKTPGDASLVRTGDDLEVRSAGGHPVIVASARVRVPPGTEIDVATAFGKVEVAGIRGAPSVSAKSSSGAIALRDLADVATVKARSDFGAVTFDKGERLGDVSLATSSGAVTATAIADARDVSLRSSFGAVSATSVSASGSLVAKTDSGAVEVEDVHAGRATLRSNFGAVDVTRSTIDDLDAHTDSGGVRLKGCVIRKKKTSSGFGRVTEEE
jgi:hypothetical protein